MSIPPDITMAANVCLFALMVWMRSRSVPIWLIQGSSILGTVALKWNDAQFHFGNLSGDGYDQRLKTAQLSELAFEFVAVLFLWWRYRKNRPCSEAEICLGMVSCLHSFTLAGFWLDNMLGWPVDVPLQTAARIWNLALIATMFWVVSCQSATRAMEEA